MCKPDAIIEDVQAAFCACFGQPPRALRVWARGRTVWCNAPLQYASSVGVSKEEAAQILLAAAPHHAALKPWRSLSNGMLETRFTEDFLLNAAKMICRNCHPVTAEDSSQPFFFERCVAIRARRVLNASPAVQENLSDAQLDLLADVLGSYGKNPRSSDILRFSSELQKRLDENLKQRKAHDIVSFALLAILEDYFQSV